MPRWHRLPFRATVFVALVVAASVCASILLLARLIHVELTEDLKADTAVMANSLIAMLGDHNPAEIEVGVTDAAPEADHSATFSELGSRIDAFGTGGERLAFVVIEAPDGIPIDLAITDDELWSWFVKNRADDPRLSGKWYGYVSGLGFARSPEALLYRASIPSSTQNNHLLLCVTSSSYSQLVRNVYGTAIGVALLACIMAMPITVIGVGRLTRPIRRMTRATLELASGQHTRPLVSDRRDEIGLLTHAFNEMAFRLHQARQELVAANSRLEDDVQQRTEQLEEANRRLQQEIDTKNEFLRSVSHDLSAPLRNINGMITMIERRFKEDLPDEVMHRLERIAVNVQAQNRMLEDLLTLSRIRTRPGTPQTVHLGQLIRDVMATFEHDLAEQNITCEMSEDWPTIFIEPNLVRQIVQNLIDNAIKYMGASEARAITISHEQIDDGWLTLAVADTGPGIPQAEQDKVFKIFQRGSTATQNDISGRGIGLPSVLAAAERWGGSVDLTSEPGHGCRFTVRIPSDRIQPASDAEVLPPPDDTITEPNPSDSDEQTTAPATGAGHPEEDADRDNAVPHTPAPQAA
ncbi:MAG: HAMP domain-containing histidine kinase [Planctomycetes bacterium]|nr:HAMP domain-containing histidine kinase [Planctomycetota bacterium]